VALAALVACMLAVAPRSSARAEDAARLLADRVFTDASTPIQVRAGQVFLIALPSNPSTGYHWIEAAGPDAGIAVFRGAAYQAPETGVIGAPGQDVRAYEAIAVGSTTIALNYVSPGAEKTIGKSVQFSVIVTKAGST
jgi:predicted secreted protein